MGKWQRAMLVVALTAFFVLRIVGTQLEEVAVDRRDPPPEYAADLLDRPEAFSAGVYLTGLAALASPSTTRTPQAPVSWGASSSRSSRSGSRSSERSR